MGDEQQDQRDQKGENAQTFGERRADEGAAELAVGGRRIAQRAREEIAENQADADGGGADADRRETRADELAASEAIDTSPFRFVGDHLLLGKIYQWPG